MSSRPKFMKTLYGACYYNEYHPVDRLNEDFQDMRDGNLSVLRVGESVWSTWEPTDGEFHLEWLLPIPDQELGKSLGNWVSNLISQVNPLISSSESVTISSATTKDNRNLYFVFNWGWETARVVISKDLHDLVSGNDYRSGETVRIDSWGVAIFT